MLECSLRLFLISFSTDRLLFDTILENVSPDHIAVSAVIAFGEFVGHDIELPEAISRQAAEAIQEYLASRRVSVREITDVPKKQWPAEGRLQVEPCSKSFTVATNWNAGDRVHRLSLADGASFSGSIGSPIQSIVASNYRVFARTNVVQLAKVLASHGVLFSRDLHVRELEVPFDSFTRDDAQRITNLVRAVDLNIRFI